MRTPLEVLEERLKNMDKQNSVDHTVIIEKLDKLYGKFDNLPDQFATRIEYDNVKEKITAIENILKGVGMTCLLAILGSLLKMIIL
jgi:hypothetical protein